MTYMHGRSQKHGLIEWINMPGAPESKRRDMSQNPVFIIRKALLRVPAGKVLYAYPSMMKQMDIYEIKSYI